MARQFYTVTAADVNVLTLRAFGRSFWMPNEVGRLMKQDIGKRLYLSGDVLQMENDQQFRARVDRTAARRYLCDGGIIGGDLNEFTTLAEAADEAHTRIDGMAGEHGEIKRWRGGQFTITLGPAVTADGWGNARHTVITVYRVFKEAGGMLALDADEASAFMDAFNAADCEPRDID